MYIIYGMVKNEERAQIGIYIRVSIQRSIEDKIFKNNYQYSLMIYIAKSRQENKWHLLSVVL